MSTLPPTPQRSAGFPRGLLPLIVLAAVLLLAIPLLGPLLAPPPARPTPTAPAIATTTTSTPPAPATPTAAVPATPLPSATAPPATPAPPTDTAASPAPTAAPAATDTLAAPPATVTAAPATPPPPATRPPAATATARPAPPTAVATATAPAAPPATLAPTPPPPATVAATPAGALDPAATLDALRQAQQPARDLYALTAQIKLRSTAPLSRTTGLPPPVYAPGATEVFQLGDPVNGSYSPVTATLQTTTAHAYWWAPADAKIDVAALRRSADRFETTIYPGDVAAFGEPPGPGVDNDPHINVLIVPIAGAGGYFSTSDSVTRAVNPYSNQRKMIYINAAPGTGVFEGTLAHEFQHMIHWNVHPNQNIWINEGMAELAMKINGYDTGGVEAIFQSNPDVQLNDWAEVTVAHGHYGAASLFMNYLYDRFGPDLIRAILHAPGADTDAIDQAFAAQGRSETFQSALRDWLVTNWVDKTTTDPRYQYRRLQVQIRPRATLDQTPATYTGSVHQQAADYITLPPANGPLQVSFTGDTTVPLIATAPHSGHGLWWSNRGELAASRMTREVDLRTVPTATLSFWAWYDLEDGYDYAYAEASSDSGQTWDTLAGPATTADNPNGNNLGHGYTGHSGGGAAPVWIQEQVDLRAYVGKRILLRFQSVTDESLSLQGFAVDDIRIPEIGYGDDAEAPGANGWTAEGFVHADPTLPQQYTIALITAPAGGPPNVSFLTLDAQNAGQWTVPAGGRATLMIAPMAPSTTLPAHYRLSVTSK